MSNLKQNENNLLLDLIEEEFDEDHMLVEQNGNEKEADANVSNTKNELNDNFQLIAASFHRNTELDSITKIDRSDFFHQVSTNSIALIALSKRHDIHLFMIKRLTTRCTSS